MEKIDLPSGNILYYDVGKFDEWCVYEEDKYGNRVPPLDEDYFAELKEYAEIFDKDEIYDDFVKIYDLTTNEFDDSIPDFIRKISLKYGKYSDKIFRVFSILYMGMISEENKKNAILKKRIKRLGVYYLLIKDKSPEYSAKFMIGEKAYILDKLCKEGGF